MAFDANSTPAPVAQAASLASLWTLASYARAATVAVDSDAQVNALLDLEGLVWRQLVARPIVRAGDAQIKLSALLSDMLERDEASPDAAMILTQVIAWLNEHRAQ